MRFIPRTRNLLPALFCLLATNTALATPDAVDGANLISPRFVAAPPATEDMLHLRGTRWVLASAVSIGEEAVPGLYAVSNDPPHIARLEVNAANQAASGSSCPGPLRSEDLSPLGIALRAQGDHWELVAINRGARAAIERFTLQLDNGVPVLEWTDCQLLPESVSANSVAVLDNGDLYVTQQFDPGDSEAWNKRVRGEPTGQLYFWSTAGGWAPAAVERLSSPNGLVVSANACYAVVAAWSSRLLVRQALPCSTRSGREADRSLTLPFMPDNLRWTPEGTILATGQDTTPQALLDCVRKGEHCPTSVSVVEIEPQSMAIANHWQLDSGPELGLGTTAEKVGEEIWVSSILGRRIARFRPRTP